MAVRRLPSNKQSTTILTVRVVLGATTSRAFLDWASSGHLTGPGDSSGRLGLRVGAVDLVGATPTLATLKVLEHIVRTLRHLSLSERYGDSPGAPGGGHGGGLRDARQTCLEFTDASASVLSAGGASESYVDVMHRARKGFPGGVERPTIKNA